MTNSDYTRQEEYFVVQEVTDMLVCFNFLLCVKHFVAWVFKSALLYI